MCYIIVWEYVSLRCEHSKMFREHCQNLNTELCNLSKCNIRHYQVSGICSMCREAQINSLAVVFAEHKALRGKHQLTGLRATIRINLKDSEMAKHEIEATLKLLEDTDRSGPLYASQIEKLDRLIIQHNLLTNAEAKRLKTQRWTTWLPWWDVKKDGDVGNNAGPLKTMEGKAEDEAATTANKDQDESVAESEDVDMDREEEGESVASKDQDTSSWKSKEVDMETQEEVDTVTNNDQGESSRKGKGVNREAEDNICKYWPQ